MRYKHRYRGSAGYSETTNHKLSLADIKLLDEVPDSVLKREFRLIDSPVLTSGYEIVEGLLTKADLLNAYVEATRCHVATGVDGLH